MIIFEKWMINAILLKRESMHAIDKMKEIETIISGFVGFVIGIVVTSLLKIDIHAIIGYAVGGFVGFFAGIAANWGWHKWLIRDKPKLKISAKILKKSTSGNYRIKMVNEKDVPAIDVRVDCYYTIKGENLKIRKDITLKRDHYIFLPGRSRVLLILKDDLDKILRNKKFNKIHLKILATDNKSKVSDITHKVYGKDDIGVGEFEKGNSVNRQE